MDLRKNQKRGVRRTNAYKAEVIKKARVKGLAYTNWKDRKVKVITSGADKDCNCRRECYTKIPKEGRDEIFHLFRSLETKDEQDIYLQSLIEVSSVKQRRRRKSPEESSKPHRSCTYVYNIPTPSRGVDEPGLVVCKTAFTNIHGITHDRIRRLCLLLAAGKRPVDMRRKNPKMMMGLFQLLKCLNQALI